MQIYLLPSFQNYREGNPQKTEVYNSSLFSSDISINAFYFFIFRAVVCCLVDCRVYLLMAQVEMVPMEDSMDALIAELVQPLLPTKMVPKPPITQQEAVAKQVSKNGAFLLLLSSG
jgi:hypothetical protein